jgi:ribosomal protein S8
MSVHDTIGDFITVIRNAGKAGKETCSYPSFQPESRYS